MFCDDIFQQFWSVERERAASQHWQFLHKCFKTKSSLRKNHLKSDKYYLNKDTWREMNIMTSQTSSSAFNIAESASDSARILIQMQACIEQLEEQC